MVKKKRPRLIGIIPARGGSQGIPGKNSKLFCGKPLIAWSILAALQSKKLDRVFVSTDSPAIARIAKRYGAEVIIRPDELATASIGIEPTLKHAYEHLKDTERYVADGIALMMPTTPTRQSFHIDNAIMLFLSKNTTSVVGVNPTPANHTPYWTLVRGPKGHVTLWGGVPLKHILTRRQDFPQVCYARNDIIYVLNPQNLYDSEKSNLYGKKVELYVVAHSEQYELDINTPGEWHDGEIKFKSLFIKPKASRK
ncbi:MAG: acylneuraminate cytidylyltransferase family protein [Candidatus Pacebacteria bacterium]|nr:acylneuraminate cytidylyltransferase family protein [Candidatus Paceibacterota bacterium]